MQFVRNFNTKNGSIVFHFRNFKAKGGIYDMNMNNLANQIRGLLRERNITQSALSELTNIPKSTLSRILTEGSDPSFEQAVQIIKALGVSLDQLVGITDEVPPEKAQEIADTAINAYTDLIAEKDKQIAMLREHLNEKEKHVEYRAALLSEKDERIANLTKAWNEEKRDKRILIYIVIALVSILVAMCFILVIKS